MRREAQAAREDEAALQQQLLPQAMAPAAVAVRAAPLPVAQAVPLEEAVQQPLQAAAAAAEGHQQQQKEEGEVRAGRAAQPAAQ